MLDTRLPHLPDDWTVWAFSEAHGVTLRTGTAALQEAGLVDDSRAAGSHQRGPRSWAAGDYLDRGGDIPGLVALLQRLPAEAARRWRGRSCSPVATTRSCH